MTDFVYDGTAVPDGKSDLTPLNGPPSKHVTATEWNTVMAAIQDLRDAILTGNYHGLITDPAAAVSPSTGVRLRNNAGKLEVSQNAGIYRTALDPQLFHVADYGASTSLADNSTAFAAAFTAAGAVGGTVYIPAGTWKVTSEMTISARVKIVGAGMYLTKIRADSAIRSIINVEQALDMSFIELDGHQLSTNAMRCYASNYSTFYKCRFTGAVGDGVNLVTAGANDAVHFEQCWFNANGTLYRTSGMGAISQNSGIDTVVAGTVATTSGSATVTGTSTTFASMGVRDGDIIRIGSGATVEYLQIKEVVSNTELTLGAVSTSTQTRSGQDFAIGVGDGYHEASSNENNINRLVGCLFRGNSGAQIMINGLYGPHISHCQIDYAPSYGIIVSDSTTKTVYGTVIDQCYFESTSAGSVFFSSAGGIQWVGGVVEGTSSAASGTVVSGAAPRWRITNASRVVGTYLGEAGIEPIGGATCTMDVTQSINQSTFAVRGYLQLVEDTATLVAGTTITPTRAHHRFDLAGDVTMTATPNMAIPAAAAGAGRLQTLTNASIYTLTLQDYGTLASSGMKLGMPTLKIQPGQSAMFLLGADNYWKFVALTGKTYQDDSGSAGTTATQHTQRGRVAISAGNKTMTVTNNLVTTSSCIQATLQTVDATLTQILTVVPGAGSFVINCDVNATAAVTIYWSMEV